MNIKPKLIKWARPDKSGIINGSIGNIMVFAIYSMKDNGGYKIFSPFLNHPRQLMDSDKPIKLIDAKKYCQGRLMNEIFHSLFEDDMMELRVIGKAKSIGERRKITKPIKKDKERS
jgi:hypothetical protein